LHMDPDDPEIVGDTFHLDRIIIGLGTIQRRITESRPLWKLIRTHVWLI